MARKTRVQPPRASRQRKVSSSIGELDTTPTSRLLQRDEEPSFHRRPKYSPRSSAQVIDAGRKISKERSKSGPDEELQIEQKNMVSHQGPTSESLPGGSDDCHSSVAQGETPKSIWDFGSAFTSDGSSLPPMSSPKSGLDQLPDTVPLAANDVVQAQNAGSNEPRSKIDLSETASTVQRSSPFGLEDARNYMWALFDDIGQSPASEVSNNRAAGRNRTHQTISEPSVHAPNENPAEAAPNQDAPKNLASKCQSGIELHEIGDSFNSPLKLQSSMFELRTLIPAGGMRTESRLDLESDKDFVSSPPPACKSKLAAVTNKPSRRDVTQDSKPIRINSLAGAPLGSKAQLPRGKKRKQRAKTPLQFDAKTQAVESVCPDEEAVSRTSNAKNAPCGASASQVTKQVAGGASKSTNRKKPAKPKKPKSATPNDASQQIVHVHMNELSKVRESKRRRKHSVESPEDDLSTHRQLETLTRQQTGTCGASNLSKPPPDPSLANSEQAIDGSNLKRENRALQDAASESLLLYIPSDSGENIPSPQGEGSFIGCGQQQPNRDSKPISEKCPDFKSSFTKIHVSPKEKSLLPIGSHSSHGISPQGIMLPHDTEGEAKIKSTVLQMERSGSTPSTQTVRRQHAVSTQPDAWARANDTIGKAAAASELSPSRRATGEAHESHDMLSWDQNVRKGFLQQVSHGRQRGNEDLLRRTLSVSEHGSPFRLGHNARPGPLYGPQSSSSDSSDSEDGKECKLGAGEGPKKVKHQLNFAQARSSQRGRPQNETGFEFSRDLPRKTRNSHQRKVQKNASIRTLYQGKGAVDDSPFHLANIRSKVQAQIGESSHTKRQEPAQGSGWDDRTNKQGMQDRSIHLPPPRPRNPNIPQQLHGIVDLMARQLDDAGRAVDKVVDTYKTGASGCVEKVEQRMHRERNTLAGQWRVDSAKFSRTIDKSRKTMHEGSSKSKKAISTLDREISGRTILYERARNSLRSFKDCIVSSQRVGDNKD